MAYIPFIISSVFNSDNLPKPAADSGHLQTVLTILFTALGAIALLMLVLAGFRYIIAAGDPQKMATSRRMIIYTSVGLIVSASAAAIVSFVLDSAG